MEFNLPTLGVIALGVLGLVAAVLAFIQTPPGQRFRRRLPTLDEQRQACPPEAEAVIIPGDWRRALRRKAWWFPVLLPMLAFAFWIAWTEGDHCAALFGVGRTRALILVVVYSLPVMLGLAFWHGPRQGIRLIRGGYWPPLDGSYFVDTLARKGRWVRLRGWALCFAPFAAAALMAYGVVSLNESVGGRTLASLLDEIEADCPSPH